ncbi:MAG: phosphoribosylamine--glycine ligase [Cenarchaeum symbiont of Oopsacas minuta]|nr:phosphoribosylamine--glycine ligase [Cenarchaeum symbiont of Oopsacas minuta]
MNALVVGSGGREHAIARALQTSPKLERVYVAPGNGGTLNNISIKDTDIGALGDFASENECFTIVGPETPIAAGIADEFTKKNLPIFAPTKAASRLESSKSWAKDFMLRHKIPTAEYGVFKDAESALKFAEKLDYHLVVKADGLASGKGVIVCDGKEQTVTSIRDILGGKFGDAGTRILVEKRIMGPEMSFIAICDGANHIPLATSQDHKRIGDGNTGPNTGGMGAYSPAIIDEKHEKILNEIMVKTVNGMKSEGYPFTGFLYAGVIFENDKPYVLEFNVRMGDPECQAILPRMDFDLFEYIEACTKGTLAKMPSLRWKPQSAVCVVLASCGYPKKFPIGEPINGILNVKDSVNVYHAGTKNVNGDILTNGGRVLGVSALGKTLADAASSAYDACAKITWPSKYCRTDIGTRNF